jgi:hypothetical protein
LPETQQLVRGELVEPLEMPFDRLRPNGEISYDAITLMVRLGAHLSNLCLRFKLLPEFAWQSIAFKLALFQVQI